VCDFLGSQSRVCNSTTGQCPCLPNVIGLTCDECKPNHWKIASGNGCEPCNCDPVGSVSEQCNQVWYNKNKLYKFMPTSTLYIFMNYYILVRRPM